MGAIRKITLFSVFLAAVAGVLGKVRPKRKFMWFVVKKGFWGLGRYKMRRFVKRASHHLHKARRKSFKSWKHTIHFGRKLVGA